MLTIVLVTVLVVLLTYIYARWVRLKQYWAKRGVPHLPPHPLLGSLTFLAKENPAVWLRRMSKCFKAPYAGIWLFWRPALIVNSTDIAKNILIKDQANFRNRLAGSGSTDRVGSLNLLMLKDPLWTTVRKRLLPNFTSAKLRGQQRLITDKSKELVQRIEMERLNTKTMNLRNIIADFGTDVIGTSSFGVVSDATLTGKSPIRKITDGIMEQNFTRAFTRCCAFFFPELMDLFRLKLFPEKTTEILREILRIVTAKRGGLDTKVTDPRDLLDILIKIKQENGEEVNMTENMMLAQAIVFFQGGFDTTATSLTFLIYELAFSPEVQDKLYEELRLAKEIHGDGLLHASVLSNLKYLNCVIRESLRKYPVIGWLDRIALSDYKVDDHLTIEAGTPVFVNIVGIHYNSDLYPDPEKFNPDRFLPENQVNMKSCSFLSFGEGPRKCIGQRFGLSTIRHGLTAILLAYQVRPLPDSPKPIDVKLEKRTPFVTPEPNLGVEFIPRTL